MAAARRVLHEIFMSRIPFTAGNRELRQYFAQFGPVVRCNLQLNKKTGFHAGFGWVGFSKGDSVTSVLNQEDHIVDGYKVRSFHLQKPAQMSLKLRLKSGLTCGNEMISVQLHDRQKKGPRRSEEDEDV